MIGILLVSHGDMCLGVKNSCEMIAGEQRNLHCVSLTLEGVDTFREELEKKLQKMEKEFEDVVIVADIPNATPFNECFRYILKNESSAQLISGMNLPMVIELSIASTESSDLGSLVEQALDSGKMSITKLEH